MAYWDSLALVFPRFASATYINLDIWLVHCIACILCDWPEWLLWFLRHSIETPLYYSKITPPVPLLTSLQFLNLVSTTQVNNTFCARWLASSEVICQVLFTSEQPKKNKMDFVGILYTKTIIHLSVGESGGYLYVIYQKRGRVFHQGFQTPRN